MYVCVQTITLLAIFQHHLKFYNVDGILVLYSCDSPAILKLWSADPWSQDDRRGVRGKGQELLKISDQTIGSNNQLARSFKSKTVLILSNVMQLCSVKHCYCSYVFVFFHVNNA